MAPRGRFVSPKHLNVMEFGARSAKRFSSGALTDPNNAFPLLSDTMDEWYKVSVADDQRKFVDGSH